MITEEVASEVLKRRKSTAQETVVSSAEKQSQRNLGTAASSRRGSTVGKESEKESFSEERISKHTDCRERSDVCSTRKESKEASSRSRKSKDASLKGKTLKSCASDDKKSENFSRKSSKSLALKHSERNTSMKKSTTAKLTGDGSSKENPVGTEDTKVNAKPVKLRLLANKLSASKKFAQVKKSKSDQELPADAANSKPAGDKDEDQNDEQATNIQEDVSTANPVDVPILPAEAPSCPPEDSKEEGTRTRKDSSRETVSTTSNEKETTLLPATSVSTSSGAEGLDDSEGSSFKENDNLSPEYSSHWTTSTETSEVEVDENFRRRFIAYKMSLLNDDDGVDASSEDETSIRGQPSEGSSGVEDSAADFAEELVELVCRNDAGKLREFRAEEKERLLRVVDRHGWNLLHMAAAKGSENVVEVLLELGMPLEERTDDDLSALQLAIKNNRVGCCKVLLGHGASVRAEDEPPAGPLDRFLRKYRENLSTVFRLAEVFDRIGGKKSSKAVPADVLKILVSMTLAEEEESQASF
ncbi:uncharacterized protein LOC129226179 [Uloborus diversus]|uniref:uncharacterized protein LOC129226179 n=1 Tax=Uloborus diversus TaxID=327109 RepID=UPI00240A4513|nr:uncharacterized protein LOC129226179 [Uloborus diversus]